MVKLFDQMFGKPTKDDLDINQIQRDDSTQNDADQERQKNELLLEQERAVGKRELRGSNTVILLELANGTLAVFKPGSGERPLEIPESQFKLYKRERAVYLISKSLGFNFVPETVIRTEDGREGSCQKFVNNSETLWYAQTNVEYGEEILSQLCLISIFDYLIWNKDRKHQNILINSEKRKIFAIDNGLSIDEWDQRWSFLITGNLKEFVLHREIPVEVVEKLGAFVNSPDQQTKLTSDLMLLVPKKTIDAMMRRILFFYKLISGKKFLSPDDISKLTYNPEN